ncbi:type II secretion system F family protein [Candidatus Falkowbacteria bacterium]|nr:type II secretion system F family protein [Candidatus Falkowbacteria bacterium]
MLYIYEAFDKNGAITKGEYDARDKKAAVSFLEGKGLTPVLVQEKGAIKEERGLSLVFFERVTMPDRIFLLRNLTAMIKAGLGILEALDILIADAEKKVLKNILTTAKVNLEKGQPLSATFSYYKKYFSPIFTGLLRAGEYSGRLEEALKELVNHLTREHELTRKVKSALTYPIILLIGSVGVVSALLFFVLPRLAVSLEQSGAKLPLITVIIINISKAFLYSPPLDILIAGGLVWFFVYFRKTAMGEKIFLKIELGTPIVRDLVKKVALVRFTRTLASLAESGISIVESLELSGKAVGNRAYKKAVMASISEVKNGIPLSNALGKEKTLFPHLLVSMMAVGEKTGTLTEVLRNFSNFYDEEVDNTLKDLVTFLEPALLLVMGLVIGAIAISILLPIYQLVSKFT